RGIPRLGVDFGEDALPAEAGWDSLVDASKGCFLGQEAVAKVRNLGHPPRLVVALSAPLQLQQGDPVLADGNDVGHVTAVTSEGEAWAILARIRWDARDLPLRARSGAPLQRR